MGVGERVASGIQLLQEPLGDGHVEPAQVGRERLGGGSRRRSSRRGRRELRFYWTNFRDVLPQFDDARYAETSISEGLDHLGEALDELRGDLAELPAA